MFETLKMDQAAHELLAQVVVRLAARGRGCRGLPGSGRSLGFHRRSHGLRKADRIVDVGPMSLALEDVGICVEV